MRHILPLLACLAAAPAIAQDTTWNFVRNGSFELIDKAPHTFDQLTAAEGWTNVTIGLSEVFDSTATPKTVGLPVNEYGEVRPTDGEHCAGFFAWKDDARRNWEEVASDPFMNGWAVYSEYLQVELTHPLKEGQNYRVSLDVMLSGNSDRAVSSIGAYCSEVPLRYEHRRFLKEKAQVASDKVLAERGKWVTITNTFVADGGERYIIIGVYPYVGWESKKMAEGYDNQYAYYYLDNVKLKLAPAEE